MEVMGDMEEERFLGKTVQRLIARQLMQQDMSQRIL